MPEETGNTDSAFWAIVGEEAPEQDTAPVETAPAEPQSFGDHIGLRVDETTGGSTAEVENIMREAVERIIAIGQAGRLTRVDAALAMALCEMMQARAITLQIIATMGEGESG